MLGGIKGDTSRIVQGDMSDDQLEMLAAIFFPMPNVPARCPSCAALYEIPMKPAAAAKELALMDAAGRDRLDKQCPRCRDIAEMLQYAAARGA